MDQLLRLNIVEVRLSLSAASGRSPNDADLVCLFASMGLRPYGEGWWRAGEAAAYFSDREVIERRLVDPEGAGDADATGHG